MKSPSPLNQYFLHNPLLQTHHFTKQRYGNCFEFGGLFFLALSSSVTPVITPDKSLLQDPEGGVGPWAELLYIRVLAFFWVGVNTSHCHITFHWDEEKHL